MRSLLDSNTNTHTFAIINIRNVLPSILCRVHNAHVAVQCTKHFVFLFRLLGNNKMDEYCNSPENVFGSWEIVGWLLWGFHIYLVCLIVSECCSNAMRWKNKWWSGLETTFQNCITFAQLEHLSSRGEQTEDIQQPQPHFVSRWTQENNAGARRPTADADAHENLIIDSL